MEKLIADQGENGETEESQDDRVFEGLDRVEKRLDDWSQSRNYRHCFEHSEDAERPQGCETWRSSLRATVRRGEGLINVSCRAGCFAGLIKSRKNISSSESLQVLAGGQYQKFMFTLKIYAKAEIIY